MIGTVAVASSELGPSTPTRFDVVASICRAAGTASAGSPRESTAAHLKEWPSTPPAPLMRCTAVRHPAISNGPNAASAPVNGSKAATVKDPPLVPLDPTLPLDPQPPAITALRTTTAPIVAGQLVLWRRRRSPCAPLTHLS